jgi:hypothetical protein
MWQVDFGAKAAHASDPHRRCIVMNGQSPQPRLPLIFNAGEVQRALMTQESAGHCRQPEDELMVHGNRQVHCQARKPDRIVRAA